MAEARAALAGRRGELAKLKEMPDGEIDFSELPELTDKFWQNAGAESFLSSGQEAGHAAD